MKAILIAIVLTGVATALLLQRALPPVRQDHDAINPSLQP